MTQAPLSACSTCELTSCVDTCLWTCVNQAVFGLSYSPPSSPHVLSRERIDLEQVVEDQLANHLLELEEMVLFQGVEAARQQFFVQRRALFEEYFLPAVEAVDRESAVLVSECYRHGVGDKRLYDVMRPVTEAVFVNMKDPESHEVKALINHARIELHDAWSATSVQKRLRLMRRRSRK